MKKGEAKKMNATTVRNILSFLLVVVVLGTIGGFYYGLQIIRSYSLEVSHAITDSSASGQNVEQLSDLKKQLADGQALVTKANQLFSTPTTYQTQALKDISKYAADSGVTITSIDSVDPATSGGALAETITLKSPVSYMSFLKFIDAIEGNLPKMQITGITIGRPASPSGDLVSTEKITITVATK